MWAITLVVNHTVSKGFHLVGCTSACLISFLNSEDRAPNYLNPSLEGVCQLSSLLFFPFLTSLHNFFYPLPFSLPPLCPIVVFHPFFT